MKNLYLDNSKSAEDKFCWPRELWLLQKRYDGSPLQKDWPTGKLIRKLDVQMDTLYYLTYGAIVGLPCKYSGVLSWKGVRKMLLEDSSTP